MKSDDRDVRLYVDKEFVSDIAMHFIKSYIRLEILLDYFKEEHHEELYGKPINN